MPGLETHLSQLLVRAEIAPIAWLGQEVRKLLPEAWVRWLFPYWDKYHFDWVVATLGLLATILVLRVIWGFSRKGNRTTKAGAVDPKHVLPPEKKEEWVEQERKAGNLLAAGEQFQQASLPDKRLCFGDYLLLEKVGEGGMAEIFRAREIQPKVPFVEFAIKQLYRHLTEDRNFVTKFINEAKIAGQLDHSNIVRIFDMGMVEDRLFIVMELVRGPDLKSVWQKQRSQGKTLPLDLAVYIVIQVCAGLDYAHNKKNRTGKSLAIVHCDVSPQNILLSQSGEVKLIDFGIAQATVALQNRVGALEGKVGYLSPEQALGESLDGRSDIFSTGIVLWELLAGEILFSGDNDLAILRMVQCWNEGDLASMPDKIPPKLYDICKRALARDRNNRYPTQKAMQIELEKWLSKYSKTTNQEQLAHYLRGIAGELTK